MIYSKFFMTKLEEKCKRTLRLRTVSSKKKRLVPRAFRTFFGKRTRIVNQISHTNSPYKATQLLKRLHSLESELQTSHKSDRKKEEQEAVAVIRQNTKFFYKYAKKFSCAKSEIGHLLNENNIPIYSSTQTSEMLRSQFESVFRTPIPEKVVTNP